MESLGPPLIALPVLIWRFKVIGGQRIVGLGILVSVSTLEFKPELEPERDNSMSRNQKDRIFKKNITRPIPKGAELFERSGQRFAKWTDKLGQKFEAPLNDTNRIQVQSETFYCFAPSESGERSFSNKL